MMFSILHFGDKDGITGQIDDKVISNNGDSEVVLATVVSALYAFTDKHPDAVDLRNRQYQSKNAALQNGYHKIFKRGEKRFSDFWTSGKNVGGI